MIIYTFGETAKVQTLLTLTSYATCDNAHRQRISLSPGGIATSSVDASRIERKFSRHPIGCKLRR